MLASVIKPNFKNEILFIQKAQNELVNNEEVIENMNVIANHLAQSGNLSGPDQANLENNVQDINKRWSEVRNQVDELSRNLEKNYLTRKVNEELATLRDVHEGYQRYINNAEAVSADPQKLNLQLETNRVSLFLLGSGFGLELAVKFRFIYLYFE